MTVLHASALKWDEVKQAEDFLNILDILEPTICNLHMPCMSLIMNINLDSSKTQWS